MLNPEQIKDKLQDRKLSAVAENTGLHYNTLRKLRDGEAKEPSYETIKVLSDYFVGEG